jgi:creatinine amidohydrolase
MNLGITSKSLAVHASFYFSLRGNGPYNPLLFWNRLVQVKKMKLVPLLFLIAICAVVAESQTKTRGILLEDLTWIEAEKVLTTDTVVVIPLGASAKEHGPHLKLKNDWLIAEYLKKRVLEHSNVIVAPTVNYHFYPAFLEYPGSTSLRLETARDLIVDIVKSLAAYGPRRFYVLNTGVSTLRALQPAVELLARDGIVLRYTDLLKITGPVEKAIGRQEGGTHADEIETSMMLFMAPATVDMKKAAKDYHPSNERGLTRNPKGKGSYSATGIYGDATLATRAKGEQITKVLVSGILKEIEDLRSFPTQSPAGGEVGISLKINEEVQQFSGWVIASGTGSAFRYTDPAGKDIGQAPGNVLFKFERANNPSGALHLWVDSDGDGNLENETSQVVPPGSSVIVKVNRKWPNGRQQRLPYVIKHSRTERQGQVRQDLLWMPHYRAEGRFNAKSCTALFAVLDLNSDGQFDDKDFSSGTSIGLDRNGDGKTWGADEYLKGNQIIEYCEEGFLIERLEADGSSITLATTALRVPRLGEKLPTFSLKTEEGAAISSADLLGKVHLLDFWASWCKPCVEKFGAVKQIGETFKQDLSIIAINVDEESELSMARQIIKDYGLRWPHVISGKGERDNLWRVFGSMEGNRLGIPLYVLVDAEGRLRYAGNGGDNLTDLQARIKDLQKKP